jgi:hypothetical protein
MLEREPACVNPMRRGWSLVLLAALACCGAPLALACTPDARGSLIEYEVLSPLVAHLGPALALRIDGNGCAELRRFKLARDPGPFRARLDAAELAALQTELGKIPADFDPRAAKLAIREADRPLAQGFAVIDAPMRRFRLSLPGRGMMDFTWNNLEQDLLNHGEEPEVLLVAAWKHRLEALARRIAAEAVR